MRRDLTKKPTVRIAFAATAIFFIGLIFFAPTGDDGVRYNQATKAARDGGEGRNMFDKVRMGNAPWRAKHSAPAIDDSWIDLTHHMPWTTYDGGVPGYSVLSNLYLFAGTLTAVVPDEEALKDIPKVKDILSGPRVKNQATPAGDDRWTTMVGSDFARSEFGKRAVRLPGITYLFNDPAGKVGYLAYYDHFFTECFVPAARVAAAAASKGGHRLGEDLLPRRIMFPRCGESPSWRDDDGMNAWFLNRVVPGASIEDANTWSDRAHSGLPYILDQVVIVDRPAAHSAQGETARWGKMNGHAPNVEAPKGFWNPFRNNMIEAMGDQMPNVGKYELPVVVFFDRVEKPMLSSESRDAMHTELKKLTNKAEVHSVRIKSMSRGQRVSLMSRASIIIDITGNNLLDAAWMDGAKPGATVIELFEEGGFTHDAGLFATILGLDRVVIQKDRVLSETEWRAHGNKRGPGKDGPIEIDAKVVARAVEEKLDSMT